MNISCHNFLCKKPQNNSGFLSLLERAGCRVSCRATAVCLPQTSIHLDAVFGLHPPSDYWPRRKRLPLSSGEPCAKPPIQGLVPHPL